ncbi:MAG: hypothetical protein J3Q66DRAFT_372312 [Benniella sp.]|nr:MAG: hypothetical protein J3Q66DRAFT_372312 [Benniella sp.]
MDAFCRYLGSTVKLDGSPRLGSPPSQRRHWSYRASLSSLSMGKDIGGLGLIRFPFQHNDSPSLRLAEVAMMLLLFKGTILAPLWIPFDSGKRGHTPIWFPLACPWERGSGVRHHLSYKRDRACRVSFFFAFLPSASPGSPSSRSNQLACSSTREVKEGRPEDGPFIREASAPRVAYILVPLVLGHYQARPNLPYNTAPAIQARCVGSSSQGGL